MVRVFVCSNWPPDFWQSVEAFITIDRLLVVEYLRCFLTSDGGQPAVGTQTCLTVSDPSLIPPYSYFPSLLFDSPLSPFLLHSHILSPSLVSAVDLLLSLLFPSLSPSVSLIHPTPFLARSRAPSAVASATVDPSKRWRPSTRSMSATW